MDSGPLSGITPVLHKLAKIVMEVDLFKGGREGKKELYEVWL
jgi:hypothetical protein